METQVWIYPDDNVSQDLPTLKNYLFLRIYKNAYTRYQLLSHIAVKQGRLSCQVGSSQFVSTIFLAQVGGCAEGGTVFPSKELLELHLQAHTGEVFNCQVLQKVTKPPSLHRAVILVPTAPEFSQRLADDRGTKQLTTEKKGKSCPAHTVGSSSPAGLFSICTPGGKHPNGSSRELKC